MRKIFLGAALLLLTGVASYAQTGRTQTEAPDTVLVRFGTDSRLVMYVSDTADLRAFREYDLNAFFDNIDSLIKTGRPLRLDSDGQRRSKAFVFQTEKKEDGERVRVSIEADEGRFRLEINDEEDYDLPDVDNDGYQLENPDTPLAPEKEEEEIKFSRTNFDFNMTFGLNQYVVDGQFPDGGAAVPTGALPELRVWGSRHVGFEGLWNTTIGNPERSPLELHYGLTVLWNNYMFENDETIEKGVRPDGTEGVVFFPEGPEAIRKSKLTSSFLNVPLRLVLNFDQGDGPGFFVGVGGYAGVRLRSHTKVKFEERPDDSERKVKDFGDFYLNDFRYGVSGMLGFPDFHLFVDYDLNNLFVDNRAPAANAVTFGVRFF